MYIVLFIIYYYIYNEQAFIIYSFTYSHDYFVLI